ncbi:hypothetical protein [Microbacterium sp. SA39]|uniref:hypothetical protein n=1 Tax=Microbacterium sp. SA39 TaxID=1263625 RepID=UPI0005FA5705|nr:hypothetical protein [Microbacterium sp. SA39]KJQ56137.1 hypothetical protein RS85_00002 [Microbacterium sp. SA39]
MRAKAATYWKALAITAAVLAIANALVTNAFVVAMTPQNWAERALPALGWALVLAALTTLFVLVSTVWLRRRARSHDWMLALLAFAGPAAAWAIIGLIIGDWLFPLYAFYGLGAGIVASGVFTLALRMLAKLNANGPATDASPAGPARKTQTG